MKMKNKASCCCEKKKSNLFGERQIYQNHHLSSSKKGNRMGGHCKEGKGKERNDWRLQEGAGWRVDLFSGLSKLLE
jgi:hypothetical protein